jgi:hypothetical protein
VDDLGTTGEKHYFAVQALARQTPVVEFFKPADLAMGAEYVVITHPAMKASAQQLADHRAAGGMTAKVFTTTEIYDGLSFGVSDPQAIRDFLAFAWAQWDAPPVYVLLFGDAAPNFKTAYAWNGPTYVPTHLFTTLEGGLAPDDNWFVTVDGTDPLPDMFIGRLPVTPTTAGGTVAKIIAYETQDDTSWTNRVQFAASHVVDNPVFENHVNRMADRLPAEYSVDRLLVRELGAEQVRTRMLANLEQGSLLTVFSGHGGGIQWDQDKVLVSDDADLMTNHARASFLVGLNCATGYFIEPFPQAANGLSLGEASVVSATGGAIGAWMAAWKGYESDQDLLGGYFMDAFLSGGPGGTHTQGGITTEAYTGALTASVNPLSIRAFNLLGDPATPLYDGTQAPSPPPTGGGGEAAAGGGGGCATTGHAAGWGDSALLLALLLGAMLRTIRHAAVRSGG